jgi:hypothetical protein
MNAQLAGELQVNTEPAMLLPMIDKASLRDAQTLVTANAGYYCSRCVQHASNLVSMPCCAQEIGLKPSLVRPHHHPRATSSA